MSRWKTNFQNQNIVARLQEYLTLLEKEMPTTLPQDQWAEYERLVKAMKGLIARTSTLDPELYPLDNWAAFPNLLQNLHSYITTFVQQKNAGYLQHANGMVDQMIGILRPIAPRMGEEEVRVITDANMAFQKKIQDELKHVESIATGFQQKLDVFDTAIEEGKNRLTENNSVIEIQKARLDESIAEFQKQFSVAQETRTKDFAGELRKIADEITEYRKNVAQEFANIADKNERAYAELFKNLTQTGNEFLKFTENKEGEITKIFGAIGSTAFAGNFKTTADQDHVAANRFRITALVLMGVVASAAIAAFYFSMTQKADWETFVFRMGTCLFLAIPAIYAANESSKHRESERLNRKIHLELTSIDAYLALLPENERNAIKGRLSEKFFGVPDPHKDDKKEAVTKKDMFSLLSTVMSNLTKGK